MQVFTPDFDWEIVKENARLTKTEVQMNFAIKFLMRISKNIFPEALQSDVLFEKETIEYSNMVMFNRFYLEDLRTICHPLKMQDLFIKPAIWSDYFKYKPKYFGLKLLRKHPKLIEWFIKDKIIISKNKDSLMQIKDLTKEEIRECFNNVQQYLEAKDIKWIKYLDLGCKVVRLISYSEEFLSHVEKQLTFVLRDKASAYDATLILWKETDFESLPAKISEKLNPKKNMRLRIEMLYSKQKSLKWCSVLDRNFSKIKPAIDIQVERGFFVGNDKEKNTYYYGVRNLDPEEFIKEGHLFVQFLNNILKTETSNLVHGAVIGLNGDGICFCARGQRGKSTLSVLSMMKGFEYVSDDYLILHKKDNQLLSSPIYSIITLSPVMYNRLYDYLKGSQFVSNNARKDKYV